MKIALIYGGVALESDGSFCQTSDGSINHGLAILSSAAKKAGHETCLFDFRRMDGWSDFESRLVKFAPDVAGLTMMSLDFDLIVKAATVLKKCLPSCVTIVGGPHPSIAPEDLEPLACFDYIMKGEGEISFPKLLQSIESGVKEPRVIQGVSPADLDDAPWSDRTIFPPEMPILSALKLPHVSVISSRGCKYNCSFCQPAEKLIFGKKVRRRSVESVIAELKDLQKSCHYNSFIIHDDCLTEDKEWVLKFCEMLKQEGLVCQFIAQSRADIICKNPDMVRVMREAGLDIMIVGFESGSDRVLKFLRKGCTRAQNIEAAKILKANGVKVWANYMIGLPTETKDEVWETYTMLKEIMPFHCSPAFYSPHPGSDLFNWGKEQGLHLLSGHDCYKRNSFRPKIKGPDYEFLTDMLYLSTRLGETSYHGVLDNLRVFTILRLPRLYHWLRHLRNGTRS